MYNFDEIIKSKLVTKYRFISIHLTDKLREYLKKKKINNYEIDKIINSVINNLEEKIMYDIDILLEKIANNTVDINKDYNMLFDKNNNEYIDLIIKELKKEGISNIKESDIKKLSEEYLKNVKFEFDRSLEDIANLSKKNNENIDDLEFDVDKMPPYIEEDFKRILSYSGYSISRDDTHYYVQNKLTGKRDKIIFYTDFNYCYFESDPNNRIYINVDLKNSDYGNESIISVDGIQIYFDDDTNNLMVKDEQNDVSYQLSSNNGILVIVKMKNDKVVSDSFDNMKREIEKLSPGLIREYTKEFGIQDTNSMGTKEEINKLEDKLNEKNESIDMMIDPRKEFYDALEAQKLKDIEDANKKIGKMKTNDNVLVLDKDN